MPRRYMAYVTIIVLFLSSIFPSLLDIRLTWAQTPIIYIKPDGTIDPPSTPIDRSGDVYTFLADVNAESMIIEKGGITVNGNWHRLNGTGFLSGKDGFNLTSLNGVTIEKVKITNFYFGIRMSQSTKITVVENEITNGGYGIYPNYSNNSVISRNKVMNNQGGGLYLTNSLNMTLEGNLFASNSYYAMRVTSTKNSTFVGNVIANNYGSGIHMQNLSTNNTVYHNDFVNNIANAINTEGSRNVWNQEYASGGNYWSDYKGTDHFSGPFQNLTGPDGIGDTPYIIDGKNVDSYPLMRPLTLTLMGDVNYDGVVDILDITLMASIYSRHQGDSDWIPQADLAQPYGVINIEDLVTAAAHYGETFP